MIQCWSAVSIRPGKRKKKPLEDTPTEIFKRLSEEHDSKKIKSAKSNAVIKKKKMKTMNAYFGKKQSEFL
jgi:hypothetical protein